MHPGINSWLQLSINTDGDYGNTKLEGPDSSVDVALVANDAGHVNHRRNCTSGRVEKTIVTFEAS